MTAPTPAAGTGDGTEVIEAVLAAHEYVSPSSSKAKSRGYEVAVASCSCGEWRALPSQVFADAPGPPVQHRTHVAAAIRAALAQGTP